MNMQSKDRGGSQDGWRRMGSVLVRIGVGVVLGGIAAGTGAAQQRLLEGYVEEAIRNNLGLAQDRLGAERAAAAVGEARSHFLPSLSFHARYSEASGVLNLGDLVNPAYRALNQLTGSSSFPTDVNAQLPFRQETVLRVTQPLFNPAIAENHRIARGQRAVQQEQVAAAVRQLAAEVQTAYLNHARALRVVELYRNTLPLLVENERVSERLLAAGKVTPDVVFRGRAERSEVEQQLAEAEHRREAARQYFNLLLDRSLDAEIDTLTESAPVPWAEVTLKEALASARQGREELRQAELGIGIAESQRRLARSARFPTVAVAFEYGIQGSEYRWDRESDFAVGSVLLQWTPINGGRDASRQRQAALERERARTRRAEAEKRIELEVETAHRALAVAGQALATADARVVAARRTFELVARRYEQGMATQVEYLDARVAHTNAELNHILTRYEHAARWVELERAAALRE